MLVVTTENVVGHRVVEVMGQCSFREPKRGGQAVD
jgi:hypothetical protein